MSKLCKYNIYYYLNPSIPSKQEKFETQAENKIEAINQLIKFIIKPTPYNETMPRLHITSIREIKKLKERK